MKERPILFSPAMVRAIRAGEKTQTRRIIKPVHGFEHNNILKYGMPYAADPWAVWWHGPESDRVGCLQECPHGVPGDRLWVREAWRTSKCEDGKKGSELEIPGGGYGWPLWYGADDRAVTWRGATDGGPGFVTPGRYRHARFMPRWACREVLELTAVRAEQLQSITVEDAIAEGVCGTEYYERAEHYVSGGAPWSPERLAYCYLWESINGPGSWARNDWVWFETFRRLEGAQ